jgi:glutamine amidotransferase
METVIIDYNAGNVQSVQYALERIGVQAVLTDDAAQIQAAARVIFPGVGHAAPAMQRLREKNLHQLIPALKQPLLGICLGMQLLCTRTDEGDTPCLGVFTAQVRHFGSQAPKVPHMGWNTVTHINSHLFTGIQAADDMPNAAATPSPSYFYFVHSYYVEDNADSAATAHYGLDFAAALHRDNFYAVQFHPEKSGNAGEILLRNFLLL